MNRELIEIYAAGGQQLMDAYQGLSQEHLLAIPQQGSWSLHQIAVHLMDSDLIGTDRMKRVASMHIGAKIHPSPQRPSVARVS